MTRYVWLNLNTGEFSNSWNQEIQDIMAPIDLLKSVPEDKQEEAKLWKLIKYECLNDESFEFYNMMKLK